MSAHSSPSLNELNHVRNVTVRIPAHRGGLAGGDDPGLFVQLHRLLRLGHPVHDGQGRGRAGHRHQPLLLDHEHLHAAQAL